jgi:hypothetical protein
MRVERALLLCVLAVDLDVVASISLFENKFPMPDDREAIDVPELP